MKLKIWTNNSFEGFWPVGTAAVVVATTAANAAAYLTLKLIDLGLDPASEDDMQEIPFIDGHVSVLHDGNY